MPRREKVAPLDEAELTRMRNEGLEEHEKRFEQFQRVFNSSEFNSATDLLLNGARQAGSRPCLGERRCEKSPFEWLTYSEVLHQSQQVSAFLTNKCGLTMGNFVGVYSKNSPQWTIMEFACYEFGGVSVPLYDTLGVEAMDYILNETAPSVMLCQTDRQMRDALALQSAKCVKHFVLAAAAGDAAESVGADGGEVAEGRDYRVWRWRQVLRIGEQEKLKEREEREGENEERRRVGRDDLAVLCYTSGTTGNPKGVQVTHGNLLAEVIGFNEFLLGDDTKLTPLPSPEDAYISYLPLAHIFERVMQYYCLMLGVRVGYYRGDIRGLADDMRELRPTLLCAVPRVLNRIREKTVEEAAAAGCFAGAIFKLAMRRKLKEVHSGVIRRNSIWDSLVFSRVQNGAGGRVRLLIVGSAPLSDAVFNFARAAFGVPVIQGFGQTETCGGCCASRPSDLATVGHVGPPLPTNLVRLRSLLDLPDCSASRNGRGEVCVKGPNVTTGYYGQREKTEAAFDSDGWLLTGDVGQWSRDGRQLRIVDRRKHLFKLAQGEYVSPERIEQAYQCSRYAEQIFVDGDSLQARPVAVVVPAVEAAADWAGQRGVQATRAGGEGKTFDLKGVCKSEEFAAAVLADLLAVGREAGLKSFEQVSSIVLHPDQFTVENNLMTPTFKLKRPELKRKFESDFQRLYKTA